MPITTKITRDVKSCGSDPAFLFPDLHVGVFRFIFEPCQNISFLPSQLGSAWRGVMGWTLQELICPHDYPLCDHCNFILDCPYYFLFEQVDKAPGKRNPHRPYMITVSSVNNLIILKLTIIGKKMERYLSFIAHSLEKGGKKGIKYGGKTYSFRLLGVDQILPDGSSSEYYEQGGGCVHKLATFLNHSVPETPWKVTLTSPLRLRSMGKYLDKPEWSFAFQMLAKRLEHLNEKESISELNPKNNHELHDFFDDYGRIKGDFTWNDWHRHSSIQKKRIPMGGIVGQGQIEPPAETNALWWRWWKIAELFHLGKGTTMGNGGINIKHNNK